MPIFVLPLAEALVPSPHPLMVLPFVAMLLSIALMPLLIPKFWEHRFKAIAVGLGALSVAYYLLGLHAWGRILHVAGDYVSFIGFIGALFVVAGGIHIRVRGEAKPWVNVVFLLIGAFLSNLIGTTGASMLLIRPWIRMNKYRFTHFHSVFFIFIVSNVGGCLTPVGDPPLFLGYLKGVPFWWVTQHCLAAWAFAVAALLAIFYGIDRANFLRAPKEVRDFETADETFQITGLANLGWLALILVAVFIPPGWRETLMVGAAAGSYLSTNHSVHEANHFSFGPIKEVAWLFLGIFATMVPALDYLQVHAASLGIRTPLQFYWLSGTLSGVLDNAPTYLTFLAVAFGLKGLSLDNPAHMTQFLASDGIYVMAISLGSVFFGAMTYIGNGPNFMVKAIADHAKVHTPGFFGYIVFYSLPVLGSIFAVVAWLYFW
jgi:Na+/H+ antiporter NhaD/arsenite permease-like protein